MDAIDITDEMLTAFLDGEADSETSERIGRLIEQDPTLATRLETLQVPLSAIRDAFDLAAKAAPTDRLAETFDTPSSTPNDKNQQIWPRWGRQIAVAASILALAVGLTVGRMSIAPDSDQDWRIAVAEYQALYARETLGSISVSAKENDNAIMRVAGNVGAPIIPDMLKGLDGVTIKRAQILRWHDAPLAQFAFLSDLGDPFAICATPTSDADQPIESRVLKGLASSSWVQDGVAYMVIGGVDSGFTARLAKSLSQQL